MEAGVLMFWWIFLAVVVALVVAGRWTSRRSRSSSGLRRAASGPSDPMEDGKRYYF